MRLRQVLLVLGIAGAFGILVPMYKGLDFLDQRLIVAYACLSAVIAAPIATDTFAEKTENRRLSSLVRVWLYSWLFAAGLLAMALFTVNFTRRGGGVILPRTSFLIATECLSLTLAAAVAGAGALLTSRFSAPNVKAIFRLVFLLVAVSLFLADRYGGFYLSVRAMTRLLYILSAIFAAAALVTQQVMLRLDASDSHNRRGPGGM